MSSFEQAFGKSPQTADSHELSRHNRTLPANTEFASEYCLLVVDPAGQERVFPVRGTLTIGRAEQNTIALNDPQLAPQHIAVSTDGSQFWFQAIEPGAGIVCNGEPAVEGWLTGGEELLVGRSGLYFFAPQQPQPALLAPPVSPLMQEPQISVPAELSNFDMRGVEVDPDIIDAAALLDQQPAPVTKKKKGLKSFELALLLGMYFLQLATIWIGFELFSLNFLSASPAAQKKPDIAAKAFQSIVQVRGLIQQNQWRKAGPLVEQAFSETPKDHPMRPILATQKQQVSRENVQLDTLDQAQRFYQDDKWVDALGQIARIPKERYAYRSGQELRQKIYVTKVKPLLQTIASQIDDRKFDEARNNIDRVLAYDPNMTAAVDLQQRLDKADPEGARKANKEANLKFGKGFRLFRSGKFQEALSYFKQLERTSAGLVRRKAGRYQQKIQDFVDVLARGVAASKSSNHDRAASLLLRAHFLSKALGGNSSRFARRLSRAIYYQGKQAHRSKKYARAMRYYKRALTFTSGYGPATAGVRRLERQAHSFYKQALVLKGVDDREARRLLRLVMKILPRSHSLHRKARRNLR